MWGIGLTLMPSAPVRSREAVMTALEEYGVETRPGFGSATAQPNFKAENLPNSDRLGSQLFSLPFPSDLSEDEVRYVLGALARVLL